MKIDIESSNSFFLKHYWKQATVLCFALLAVLVLLVYQPQVSISKQELKTTKVEQGNVNLMVPIHGEFASRYERLISAPSNGKVVELFLKAGADVEPNSVIARLENTDLLQELLQAKSDLQRIQSEYQIFELSQQNKQLEGEARLSEFENQIKAAELELSANKRLAQHGIVAKIDLEKSQLKHEQLLNQKQFHIYRVNTQREINQKELEQKLALVKLQQSNISLLKDKINQLQIKAGISGKLQHLYIDLGQQLAQNGNIAKVGSNDELMVNLKIPQRLSGKVNLGAAVELRHSSGSIQAEISQLSAIIENGFIEAEAIITSSLPNNIRPAQAIDGHVFVEKLPNVLFVKQQPGMIPLSNQTVFVMSDNSSELNKSDIHFGELSKNRLVIKSGVKKGDRIAINDLSHAQKFSRIIIE
ncbi:HlyD family efflux transporter periplasmic adaptor subunit [Parashewanella curva]|uniref:HlyD family efflux transporter periplasmic adaptor subunit n=1 Tax=Parashewanella curva TaxID=2338552 RepID=A0A3L8Q322_9GAMM|nr:HlyD family efflux transporter periplasmic adaptor subunit [Parashewanella curva]RLV61498.1 HlyD family efflux transporter periplasmic adaptor subunit [Parashewanella curva]